MVEDPPLTDLIKRAQDGDRHALKSVFDVTYGESSLRFANARQLCIEDRQPFLLTLR